MKNLLSKQKLVVLVIILGVYTAIITPLIINNLQKQQHLNSHAQTISAPAASPTPQVCSSTTTDTMLIIDRSGSMNDQDGSSGTKISNAKTAAGNFVDIMAQNPQNHVGLVSFATTATLNSALTSNYSSVKSQISSLTVSGDTCIQCAIDKANQEIAADGRSGVKKVVVLLTDGIANYIEGGTNKADASQAEQAALNAAASGHNANGTIYYTIGLGSDVNGPFLTQLATSTGASYFFPPTTDDLNQIYQQISLILSKGSVTGTVFNDANDNGIFDAKESPLSGWTIQLFLPGTTTPQIFTSSATGSFTIPNLCNGTYTLKEVTQTGWQQTEPTNANGYTVAITNGNALANENFGNYFAPTPTPMPTNTPTPKPTAAPSPTAIPTQSTTTLSLTVYEHGIGNSGDNTNPNQFSLSNKNPLHKQISGDIQVFNAQNQIVASGSGTLTYNPSSGNFQGSFICNGTNNFTSGDYNIKIKTQYHLRQLLPGIQSITVDNTNDLPPIALIAGDVNNDNQLSILDYNMLLGCYSDLAAATACSSTNKVASDLNDDGFVNQIDYNLFLREIVTQPGE